MVHGREGVIVSSYVTAKVAVAESLQACEVRDFNANGSGALVFFSGSVF